MQITSFALSHLLKYESSLNMKLSNDILIAEIKHNKFILLIMQIFLLHSTHACLQVVCQLSQKMHFIQAL